MNLALVHERFGHTPEYAANPLFHVPALNRVLLLKHVVRASERYLFDTTPVITTKILLPFAANELGLGGRSLLLGERSFERALREIAGATHESHVAGDLELLRLIDSLPSFDPFLMRERLRQGGYEPARCYFEMSDADIRRMREFVGAEIEQFVGLAFKTGGPGARDLSRKLAEKLMTDEAAKALDPLRAALQLSEDEYREGVFSWKGFLYYKWLAATLLPGLPDLTREMLSARVNGADPEARQQLAAMRTRIVDFASRAVGRIETALLDYGAAFAGLSQGSPTVFRDFLLYAPSLFIPIGEAIGVIQHIKSFWQFRFPAGQAQLLQADEAFEIFSEFEANLGAMAVLHDGEAPIAVI